jgi:hypothetical protein
VKRLGRVALIGAVAVVASAHVGSPTVFFTGKAGPYDIRVIVRPPMVVPGLADIFVRAPGPEVTAVTVRPVFWRAGVAGAPQGDRAVRVEGEPLTFAARLWLMSRGAYSVYVTVDGARGPGTVIVPVMSLATGRLGVSRGLAIVLIPLGFALVVGLIKIVHAAAGDSLVPAGGAPEPARKRRANMIAAVSAPVIALLVFGGAKWWNAVDAGYERTMYRPPETRASVNVAGGRATLELTARDTALFHALVAPVVPDHGKMMHLFLVSDAEPGTFAHLHPVLVDTNVWAIGGARVTVPSSFRTVLPPLPAGRYRVFGDLTMETGATQTLATTVDLPAPVAGVRADSDDAWTVSHNAVPIAAGATDSIGGGLTMQWAGDPTLAASWLTDLRFTVHDATGAIADLEPYLEMAAHAVVMRDDGSVFVHLHPMGTVSTAAQTVFALRDRGDTTAGGRVRVESAPAMTGMSMRGELSFPYEFPTAGRYRIWVQVKRGGRVLTGAFTADVH